MKDFTCDCCGGEFKCDSSEEDILKEMKDNFGNLPEEVRSSVCDDCYHKIMDARNQ